MKKLIDFKEEIYKCSKCGLCQKVCPVYKSTGNECALSRGKFVMLNGVINNHISLAPGMMKYFDMCLNCNACKDFCPSKIDVGKIFTYTKSEYKKNKKYNLSDILTSYNMFKFSLRLAKAAFLIYRFLKIDKLIEKLAPFILKFGFLGKKILLANTLATVNVKRKKTCAKKKTKIKAVYFAGCVNNFLNPGTKNAVLNLFDELGVEYFEPEFECCGVSYYSKGLLDEAVKLVETNLKKLPADFDYFITDCASCSFMLENYTELANDELFEKALMLKEKSVSILEFLNIAGYKKEYTGNVSVTCHKPCHSNYDIKDFIKNSTGANYKEMNEYDSCCGFAGDFALRHHDISLDISSKKAQNIIETGAQYVLTSCPACVLGLKQGLLEKKSLLPVMNLVEFLSHQ